MVLEQVHHHAVLEDDALRLGRSELDRLEPHLPRVGLSDRRGLGHGREGGGLAQGNQQQNRQEADGALAHGR
jgi:hypothetical protein